jgi:manganese/iron transport system ATP-binding protein
MAVRKALKRGLVAYVPQAEEVDWSFPVLVDDVVMMGRYGHMGFCASPAKADREAVDSAGARQHAGVSPPPDRRAQGGQRKRVFLARALAQGGRVILLDEPFTGVDVKTEDQIVALMRELRAEGRLMLVSTHNLGSIPDFCDQVVFINKTVLAPGRPRRPSRRTICSAPSAARSGISGSKDTPCMTMRMAPRHRHHRRRAAARALWRARP